MKSGRPLNPVQGRQAAGSLLTPVRWVVVLGILATLPIDFEVEIRRAAILAAVAVYAALVAGLPRLQGRLLTRYAVERLLLAADLLLAAAVSDLSGGLRSPYFGLWYLAMIHTALVLRPPVSLGVAAGAALLVVAHEIHAPDDPGVLLHLYVITCKLTILPLIAWAGGRLAGEIRNREVARRLAVQRVAAVEAEDEQLRHEMEVARRVQEGLLPRSYPALRGVNIAAFFHPAREVGGDIYDVIELPDGRVLIAVADVCGKGVPAALLAVAVQQGVRQFAGPDPAAVLAGVNRLLLERSLDSMFATAACVVLDPRDGVAAVATAGHPPPLLWEEDGQRLAPLRTRGLVLGLEPEWVGQTDTRCLAPGDALLLYTDGVVDARVGRRERLGEERLTRLLGQAAPEDAGEWVARLRRALEGCVEWPDDVTAVAVVRTARRDLRRAA